MLVSWAIILNAIAMKLKNMQKTEWNFSAEQKTNFEKIKQLIYISRKNRICVFERISTLIVILLFTDTIKDYVRIEAVNRRRKAGRMDKKKVYVVHKTEVNEI